jgi:hypothetical protein
MRTGAPWLKTVLIQCAWAAARTKGSYFQSLYHRLRSRRGAKKAIGAVAASLLTTIYHMLKNGTLYEDLGANYFESTLAGALVVARACSVPFDASSIGGRVYNCQCPSSVLGNTYSNDVPQQYIAIGVPGATPGSAYETYTTSANTSPAAAATGMLAEDASGNYNFQPSGNIEYMVQPALPPPPLPLRLTRRRPDHNTM